MAGCSKAPPIIIDTTDYSNLSLDIG